MFCQSQSGFSALSVDSTKSFLIIKYFPVYYFSFHFYYEETWPRSSPSLYFSTQVACVTGEHSSKELFEQLILLPFVTSTCLPQCLCSSSHGPSLGCRQDSTCHSLLLNNQALVSPDVWIMSGSRLWRDLTKIICILNKITPRQTCLGRESSPGRRRHWQAL